MKRVLIIGATALIISMLITSCYIPRNGLYENEKGIRYFSNDVYQTGWIEIDGKEYYFSRVDGYMVRESQILEGQWYGINPDGTRAEGFFKDNEGTRYYVDGIYLTGWQELDGKKYYFAKENGYMVTGEYEISGIIHRFDKDGVYTPTNGFYNEENGTRYYVNDIYQTGWIEIDGEYYYFSRMTGYLVRGSQTIDGQWYGITNDGKRANGFLKDKDGTRYYNNGIYISGWQEIAGERYYFAKDTGIMAVGSYTISGVTYNFSEEGILLN